MDPGLRRDDRVSARTTNTVVPAQAGTQRLSQHSTFPLNPSIPTGNLFSATNPPITSQKPNPNPFPQNQQSPPPPTLVKDPSSSRPISSLPEDP